jgi:hypothetical protein
MKRIDCERDERCLYFPYIHINYSAVASCPVGTGSCPPRDKSNSSVKLATYHHLALRLGIVDMYILSAIFLHALMPRYNFTFFMNHDYFAN